MKLALIQTYLTKHWVGLVTNTGYQAPQGRLELPFLAPEANALSTELLGRAG